MSAINVHMCRSVVLGMSAAYENQALGSTTWYKTISSISLILRLNTGYLYVLV